MAGEGLELAAKTLPFPVEGPEVMEEEVGIPRPLRCVSFYLSCMRTSDLS